MKNFHPQEGSVSDQEGKKKIKELKTYSVLHELEEIKKNLTINTNTSSKPSKEQIINKAFMFHSQGNISEAAKYYQICINKGLNDPKIFEYDSIIRKNPVIFEALIYEKLIKFCRF